ncbi:AlpA family transcriptional regulator [Salinisphaera sp. T31B1]|uniref:AlpA family transcriptional regulator n=1 Tax=Salinisphaera aquimarina TaxID=2094031 RepID=A0ABV7ESB5_9GAMM
MSESTVATASAERRILRRPEVEAKTGFKRAHIYNLIKQGRFPKPMRLGVRAVGWDSLEIEAWIAERLNERA